MAITFQETLNKLSPDHKRKAVLAITVIVLALIAWVLVIMSQSNEPKARDKSRPVSHELLTVRDPRSLGIDGLKAEMDQMKRQIHELLNQNKDLMARGGRTPGGMPPNTTADVQSSEWGDLSEEDRAALERIRKAPPNIAGNSPGPLRRSVPTGMTSKNSGQPGGATPSRATVDALMEDKPLRLEIKSYGDKDDEGSTATVKADPNWVESVSGAKVQQNARFVLPAGAILEGVLMTGLDAPTASQARQQPYPVLVRIKHEALLPNRWRSDIRECFLIASAYGDLASERAYLRAEAISCVRDDGSLMESTMDAFATGEDGKNGIRGRLVSKQGTLIAQALMGGFIQGIANVYKPARVPQLTLGTAGTNVDSYALPHPGLAAQEGIASGVQMAGKAVADFYIDMARHTFPIIEVDAGRKVAFVVSRSANVSTRQASRHGGLNGPANAAMPGASGSLGNSGSGFANSPIGRSIHQVMNGGSP